MIVGRVGQFDQNYIRLNWIIDSTFISFDVKKFHIIHSTNVARCSMGNNVILVFWLTAYKLFFTYEWVSEQFLNGTSAHRRPFQCHYFTYGLFATSRIQLISLHLTSWLVPSPLRGDMQIYGSCPPSAVHDLQQRLSAYMDDVHFWMQSNRLQLNTNKTELLWYTTALCQHQVPRSALRIGSADIIPATAVHDLGIYIDADLSMRSHVQRTVAGCFAILQQLRNIRRSVPSSVFQTLVVALVLTRLDFSNATLSDLSAYLLNRLQSVLNASARLIAGLHRSAHIADSLASFHWLRSAERIKFKLAVIVYRALHSTAPQHLSDMLRRVADIPSRSRLRSSTSSHLVVRPSRLVTVGERWLASAGPRLWNSLPDDITTAQSLPAFSKKTENLPISAIIPGHYTVVSDCSRHGGPSSYFLL